MVTVRSSIEGVLEQIAEVSALAHQQGRKVKFGLNAFAIARDTEAEAYAVLEEVIAQADEQKTKSFSKLATYTGVSKHKNERRKRWASSDFSDLMEYSDGFKTGLIGTPEQLEFRLRHEK
jgi:FMNH2-dependent dimethyl sulfone monooxygenase